MGNRLPIDSTARRRVNYPAAVAPARSEIRAESTVESVFEALGGPGQRAGRWLSVDGKRRGRRRRRRSTKVPHLNERRPTQDEMNLCVGIRRPVRSAYASRQSDANILRRSSLHCIWTSCLELSADGPHTAGFVIQPFQTVAENVSIHGMQ